MAAPDKIYLHGYSFSDEPVKSWEREPKVKRGVTGFKPQYAEYIRKDALLEWLKERRHDLYDWNFHKEQRCWATFDEIIKHLNSM